MPVEPASLRLRIYPDPILRCRAEPIEVTQDLRAIATRMLEIMRESEGIGLAAPQVGLPWRLFVSHVIPGPKWSASSNPPAAEDSPCVYINPSLSDAGGALLPHEEGCLSLPEITGVVLRPDQITITATDLEGKRFTRRGSGLLARCWQHEVDHLDGVLIIDRMTQIHRLKNRSALRRLESEGHARL